MVVRKSPREDTNKFHKIRLEALRKSPEASLKSLQKEESLLLDEVTAKIESSTTPPENFVFGVFMDSR